MNSTPARNTKVMNRFDLTSRLIAKLKHEEAVVGGIGNCLLYTSDAADE